MTFLSELKQQFDAEDNTFLMTIRDELYWNWDQFFSLSSLMYQVADTFHHQEEIDKWIAEGFWFCDTWIREWTMHSYFPQPSPEQHEGALNLIHDLAFYLFQVLLLPLEGRRSGICLAWLPS